MGLALREWRNRDAISWGAELCRELVRRGAVPVLLPMHEPEDWELAEKISATGEGGLEVMSPPDGIDDLLAAIRSCEVVVGMRLHALLLAANAGLPVVAWSYDPKVDALMERLGAGDGMIPLETTPARAAMKALEARSHLPDPDRLTRLRGEALRTLELLAAFCKGL